MTTIDYNHPVFQAFKDIIRAKHIADDAITSLTILDINIPQEIGDILNKYHEVQENLKYYLLSTLPEEFLDSISGMKIEDLFTSILYGEVIHMRMYFLPPVRSGKRGCSVYWDKKGEPHLTSHNDDISSEGFSTSDEPSYYYYISKR